MTFTLCTFITDETIRTSSFACAIRGITLHILRTESTWFRTILSVVAPITFYEFKACLYVNLNTKLFLKYQCFFSQQKTIYNFIKEEICFSYFLHSLSTFFLNLYHKLFPSIPLDIHPYTALLPCHISLVHRS